ncbi:MAG: ATP phosphoribosyltransferase [Bacteroidota bacterium]
MEKLSLAIQKSGRLHESSVKLLKECGIRISNGIKKLKSPVDNFPMEIFYLRDDDIPQYVEDGVADLGIVGENVVLEKDKDVQLVEKLGFARCRLSLAVPKDFKYNSIRDLSEKEIATTYEVILKKYLKEQGVSADVREISGSVEIAPGIGLADAICDLVSTGSTLFMNGLKEVETVLKSEAVLIRNHELAQEKLQLLDQLLFRIKSVNTAKNNKYILLNIPNEKIDKVADIIPGMKSPTVVPLEREGWSSIHSVVKEDDFWSVIESLKSEGAEGILVVPIEKMVL